MIIFIFEHLHVLGYIGSKIKSFVPSPLGFTNVHWTFIQVVCYLARYGATYRVRYAQNYMERLYIMPGLMFIP